MTKSDALWKGVTLGTAAGTIIARFGDRWIPIEDPPPHWGWYAFSFALIVACIIFADRKSRRDDG